MKTLAQAYKAQFGSVNFPFEIYDSNGNQTYYENSNDWWVKRKYDSNGNKTYYENSNDWWEKRVYDSNGNETYYEASDGFWSKREYNANGKETYYEGSDGHKRGTPRSQSCAGKVIEVDWQEIQANGTMKSTRDWIYFTAGFATATIMAIAVMDALYV